MASISTFSPLEYIQSCVDLVTDAFFDDGLSFTEKTWKPVAHKSIYSNVSIEMCISI